MRINNLLFILTILIWCIPVYSTLILYNDNGLNNSFGTPTIFLWGSGSSSEPSDNNGHPYDPSKYQQMNCNPTYYGGGIVLNLVNGQDQPVNLSSYVNSNTKLKFYLRLSRSLTSNELLKVEIQDNTDKRTVFIFQNGSGSYGYNNNLATSWQWISIPLSAFSGLQTNSVRLPFMITAGDLGSSVTLYWDYVSWNDDDTAPQTPTLQSPQNNEIVGNTQVYFQWTAVSDPSGIKYWIQVDNNSDFSSPEVNAKGLTNNNYTTTLMNNTTYWWRVAATDGAGNISSFSTAWKFVVDSSFVGKPMLITPTNGLRTVTTKPFFDWTTVSNAVSYHLQVDDNVNFTSPEINVEITVSSYQATVDLSAGTTYWWRVRAKNAQGNYSEFTTARNFYTLSIYTVFTVINDVGAAGFVGTYQDNGSINIQDDYYDYKEGMKSIRADYNLYNNSAYAGWYVEEGEAGGDEIRDMSNYQHGYLYFWIK
ncbi:MAG: hypothetical protein NZ839_03905, partial [Endomicrobia bacterium]|nr:hypothetical protein [Endomicrobiia bacterium]